MKLIISLSLLIILSSCNIGREESNKPPVLNISKQTTDFNISFNPEKSFLFDNHLFMFGNDSVEANHLSIIDIDKNKIDSALTKEVFDVNITDMYVSNDTLLAFFKGENSWKYWSNGWLDYEVNNDFFYGNIADGRIRYLLEDSIYIVYAYEFGEFGGTINFYNKKSKKLYATELYGPNTCIKKDGKYIVNGSLAHENGIVEVIEINNPEVLILLPDSLNVFSNDRVFLFSDYIKPFEYELLPDSIVNKVRVNGFYSKEYYYLSKKILQSKQNISSIIYSNGILCYSTFYINNQLVHFIQDTTLFIGVVLEDSLYRVDELYKEDFFTYYNSTSIYKESVLMSFSYWQRVGKQQRMICLIWHVGILKRYNVY